VYPFGTNLVMKCVILQVIFSLVFGAEMSILRKVPRAKVRSFRFKSLSPGRRIHVSLGVWAHLSDGSIVYHLHEGQDMRMRV